MRRIITLFGSELLLLPIIGFYIITKDSTATMYLVFSLMVGEVIGNLTKVFFFKHRPIPMHYNNIFEKILAGSFPSIHTMRTCTIFLFSLKYCIKFSPIFFIIYILVGISRIKVKKHFFIDTIGGTFYAIGLFMIFLIIYNMYLKLIIT